MRGLVGWGGCGGGGEGGSLICHSSHHKNWLTIWTLHTKREFKYEYQHLFGKMNVVGRGVWSACESRA